MMLPAIGLPAATWTINTESCASGVNILVLFPHSLHSIKQQRDETRSEVRSFQGTRRSRGQMTYYLHDTERAQGKLSEQSMLYARRGERHKELVTPESGAVSVGSLAKNVPVQIAGQCGGEGEWRR